MSHYAIFIDNTCYQYDERNTILQACSDIAIYLPLFCYHEALSIAGNCRMCLVEVSNSKKLQVACGTTLTPNLCIITDNFRLHISREAVLEFLLINHPLDCPICDQAGECDLQEVTYLFGSDRGRYYEGEKRSFQDTDFGPMISTVMTRCIHCTRCIRYLQELTGNYILGMVGRGSLMEITTYVKTTFNDELSANIIDLCPVGALNSKPYSFTARNWELDDIYSIDVFDSLGSNINIQVYLDKVIRILPAINNQINDEWITNKIRFFYDCILIQRYDAPMYKIGWYLNHIFVKTSWRKIFQYIFLLFYKFAFHHIQGLFGSTLDLSALLWFKDFFSFLGLSNFGNVNLTLDFRHNYLLNMSLLDFNTLSLVIFLGSEPRLEVPLLASRLRQFFLLGFLDVVTYGLGVNYLTFPVNNSGLVSKTLYSLVSGFSKTLCKKMIAATNTKIILGKSLIKRWDIKDITNLLSKALFANVFGFLEIFPGDLAAYDLGLTVSVNASSYKDIYKYNIQKKTLLFCMHIDSIQYHQINFIKSHIILIGTNGDNFGVKANVILPGCSFVERDSVYVNIEGSLQTASEALGPIAQARSDRAILQALSVCFQKKWKSSNTYKFRKCLNKLEIIYGNIYSVSKVFYKVYKRLQEILPCKKYPKYDLYVIYINNKRQSMYKMLNSIYDIYIYNYFTSHSMITNSPVLSDLAWQRTKINMFQR